MSRVPASSILSWITTEFWSINFDRYNQTQADADTYDRRMWKVPAYGGNGLNFYFTDGHASWKRFSQTFRPPTINLHSPL